VSTTRTKVTAVVLSALCLLLPFNAQAQILAQAFSNPNAVVSFGPQNGQLVPFNANGTSLTYTTTRANQTVVITFTAVCSVAGNSSDWIDIDILSDPRGVVPEEIAVPTFVDQPFCSGNDTPDLGDGWVTAVINARVSPPVAGSNQRVRVQLNGRGHNSQLRAMSLVVTTT
jgi:hypothetical protein